MVRAQRPRPRLGGPEFVDHGLVPRQEHSRRDGLARSLGDQYRSQPGADYELPQQPEETTGLDRDALAPPRPDVEPVEGANEVLRPGCPADRQALAFCTTDVALNL